jgi:hypothetical protein
MLAIMSLNYVKPKKVASPMDYVQEVTPIFDGTEENERKEKSEQLEDFSLAILKWNDEYTLGIRWNFTMREANDPAKQNGTKICKGIPVSFTHPVWLVLPKLLHQSVLESLKSFIPDEKRKEIYDKLEIKL